MTRASRAAYAVLFQILVLAVIALAEAWVRVAGQGPGVLGALVFFVPSGALVVLAITLPSRWLGASAPVSLALAAAVLVLPHVPFKLRSGAHFALGGPGVTTAEALAGSWREGPATVQDARLDLERTTSRRWKSKHARHEVVAAPLVDEDGAVHLWACAGQADLLAAVSSPPSGWYTRAPDYGYTEAIARVARPGEARAGCLMVGSDTDFWLGALPLGLLALLELVVLGRLVRG